MWDVIRIAVHCSTEPTKADIMTSLCGSVKVYTSMNTTDALRITASSGATGGAWAGRACMIWQTESDIHLSFALNRRKLFSQVDSLVSVTVCFFPFKCQYLSRISHWNLRIIIMDGHDSDKAFLSCICLNMLLFFKNLIYCAHIDVLGFWLWVPVNYKKEAAI